MTARTALTTDTPPIALFASFSGAGGVERMLVNLIHGLLDLGVAVDLVLVRAAGPHLGRLPAGVRRFPLGVGHSLLAVPALARYLRARRPLALLAAKDRAGRAAVLARTLAGTGTPLLLRLGTHLSAAMAGRSPLSRALRYGPIRLLYPAIDRIIAVSAGVAADTARIARMSPARISVVPNPVITPHLAEDAAAPCPHPWFTGARGGRSLPVILGAGRLERQKDFPTLLTAFAELRRQRPCRLVILGDGGERARLLAQAARLGIAADLDLPGFQPNPYPFLAQADLFVLSSRWEGSPNVLTEALALGTPAVATDCPSGPRELLADGAVGPLVPVGDGRALAAAMARTLADPPPAARLQAAVADYRQALSAARYLALIRQCAGLADPGSPP